MAKKYNQPDVGEDVLYQNRSADDTLDPNNTLEVPLSKSRIWFVLGIVLAVFALFVVKAYSLQVVNGDKYLELAENNRIKLQKIFPQRGIIYDRNGVELAWNVNSDDLEFDKRKYIDSPAYGILGYVVYPEKDQNGYYWRDSIVGVEGIEKYFNDELSGTPGIIEIEKDVGLDTKVDNIVKLSVDGEDIDLSIDKRLQEIFYNSIENFNNIFGYKGGAGILMDIDTGELLAIASYPYYNPNDPTNKSGGEHYSMLNRAIDGLYTPGSTVKPFLALGALDMGIIDENTTIFSRGYIEVPNKYNPELKSVFRDWKKGGHGYTNVVKAIEESVNTFFYAVGGGYEDIKGMGIKNINKYMSYFGFGKKTGIDFFESHSGTVPSPEWKKRTLKDSWRLGDTYITSIGQFGFQVTPIQMTRAMAILARDGKMVTPTIRKVDGGDATLLSDKQEYLDSIPDKYYDVVKKALRRVVTDGTAKWPLYGLDNVGLAGKTGTAQVGKNNEFINSWFVGFFPYENPKYAITVVLERGPKEDGVLSAPWAVRDIIKNMQKLTPEYFGMSKLQEEDFGVEYGLYLENTSRFIPLKDNSETSENE